MEEFNIIIDNTHSPMYIITSNGKYILTSIPHKINTTYLRLHSNEH